MDQALPYNTAVLQTLLKTNRPATDEERAIIQESMAPAHAELETVKEQISDAMAHIQALKSQLEQAEIGLERLRKKEATILKNTAYHRGVLSTFRDLPEDVLREICLETVKDLSYCLIFPYLGPIAKVPPYQLMQISRGIRRIVLETPSIWAFIKFQINSSHREDEREFATLICEARKWVHRAGELDLNILVTDLASEDEADEDEADEGEADEGESTEGDTDEGESDEDVEFSPANELINFLLAYSTRWKSVQFGCSESSTLITSIAALPTVNVPRLQSLSFLFKCDTSIFANSTFLTVPTLETLFLAIPSICISDFTVNWEILTSLTLMGYCCGSNRNLSAREIAIILQKTKCLTFCHIEVDYNQDSTLRVDYPSEINLPLLKNLYLKDELRSSENFSILGLIKAPILQIFELHGEIFEASTSKFFKQSPNIQEISLHHFFNKGSLMLLAELLRLCPSLIVLSLTANQKFLHRSPLDVNGFLQIFVQEDDVVTCPRLQYFTFGGRIDVSLQTLREFLEGKQRGIATTTSLCPWKGVSLDLSRISNVYVRQQMSNLCSRKLEEGLNVAILGNSNDAYSF